MDFYDFFIYALKNSQMSNTEFARAAGASKQHVTDMSRKRRTPPLDRLEAWADALKLDGEPRATFLRLAHLAHAPAYVRDMAEGLAAQVKQVEAEKAALSADLAALRTELTEAQADLASLSEDNERLEVENAELRDERDAARRGFPHPDDDR